MTKQKVIWACQECGHTQAKWTGNCPACKRWNTITEEMEVVEKNVRYTPRESSQAKPIQITKVTAGEFKRVKTNMVELDRLLGGGLVTGSLSLVAGEPGIGKSTIMMQLAASLAKQGLIVLYVCGEESTEQTSLRAKRIGVESQNLYLLSETHFGNIKAQVEHLKPDLLIVDSVQILYKPELPSSPGSVTQVREIATECMHLAKSKGISTLLIGHVTKSGEIAGPRVLEHIVDTVLEFEGDRQHGFRMLRAVKNRFGPTDDVALFQMEGEGLKEVLNPSEIFLEERTRDMTGGAIIPTIEGSRAILIEVQALVAASSFSTSSRKSTGLDQNRLALLLAVLEKRMGYSLYNCDVFVSIAGGMKIREPAIDLGILMSIASSFCNRPLDSKTVIMGEVGLSGEVRRIPRIEARIKEAINLGFSTCVLPKKNLKSLKQKFNQKIRLLGVDTVDEAIHELIG